MVGNEGVQWPELGLHNASSLLPSPDLWPISIIFPQTTVWRAGSAFSPSRLFKRLQLILQKRPSDAWHGPSLGSPSYVIRSQVARGALTQASAQCSAWGSASWVCPHRSGWVSNAQGTGPQTFQRSTWGKVISTSWWTRLSAQNSPRASHGKTAEMMASNFSAYAFELLFPLWVMWHKEPKVFRTRGALTEPPIQCFWALLPIRIA